MAETDSPFLGVGWTWPVRPDTGGRLAWAAGRRTVEQSMLLVLETVPGERLMLPDFGCGIHELVFQANTDALRGLVAEQVREALTRWEPRVDVLDVRAETQPGTPHCLDVTVGYRIRANNAFHNLVYPFFLDEGAGQSGAGPDRAIGGGG